MPKQIEKIHTRRIVGLALICVTIFLFAVARLFQYQVVNGEEYLKAAQKSSYTTVKIEAARGEIVDRFGVPFTQNKASFDVELDYAFLKRGEENKVIYSLIKTFEALNEEYIDNLPITMTKPYEFLPNRESDIVKLKNNVVVNSYASAQDCMDALYERSDSRYEKTPEYKDKGLTGIEYLPYSEEYKRKLAGVRYEMISKSFSINNSRYTFASGINADTVAFLRELSTDFPGVEVTEKASRTYVGGEVASHIIGKIGLMNEKQLEKYMNLEGGDYAMDDRVGQGGVEEAFESTLRGKNGEMKVIKNPRGDVIDIIETIAPQAGKTIALTIDYNFNKEVNDIFAAFIKDFNETNKDDKFAEAGGMVVLDAKTGGLLASSSYPYFDQNLFYTDYNAVAKLDNTPMFNRVLQGLYRPGSTFKPVVAVGGLAENIVTPETHIYCDGYYRFWPDWNPPPSCLGTRHIRTSPDVVTALQWSCNTYFYDTGRLLTIERMNQYAHLLGLGTETGLEIPNAKGNISSRAFAKQLGVPWEEGNVIQAAIGQMDTQVTPLQMAIEAMTIGNKGTRYNTHLLRGIYSHDGKELLEDEKTTVASSFTMPNEYFNSVIDGMVAAGLTINGAGSLADMGYRVAVKTGTPQVTVEKTNNAFIAFAPADNPQIAIACMLEDGLNTNKMIKQVLEAYQRSATFAQK